MVERCHLARQEPGVAATTTSSRFHSRIARVLVLSALRASGCHWPSFPGPDGPGYWLTALRALCVTHHLEGTDWAMIWLRSCGRGVSPTAQVSSRFPGHCFACESTRHTASHKTLLRSAAAMLRYVAAARTATASLVSLLQLASQYHSVIIHHSWFDVRAMSP